MAAPTDRSRGSRGFDGPPIDSGAVAERGWVHADEKSYPGKAGGETSVPLHDLDGPAHPAPVGVARAPPRRAFNKLEPLPGQITHKRPPQSNDTEVTPTGPSPASRRSSSGAHAATSMHSLHSNRPGSSGVTDLSAAPSSDKKALYDAPSQRPVGFESRLLKSQSKYGKQKVVIHSAFTLDPASHRMRVWDMVMLVLLLFTATVTPFEVAFLAADGITVLFVVNRVVDLLFLGDMAVNFMLRVTDARTGRMIARPRDIALRYLRGWFVIDLISVLPYDILGILIDSDEVSQFRFLRGVRLLRLIKLLRILRALRILERFTPGLAYTYAQFTMMKYVVLSTIVAHWTACMWRLGANINDSGDVTTSWVTEVGFDSVTSDPGGLYFTCLYWSVMTVATIGTGDIIPQTIGERVVAIACMMVGGSVYAYVIGSVCGIVSNMDVAQQKWRQTMDHLSAYMKELRLPYDLQLRLHQYFYHCRDHTRTNYFKGLLFSMSPQLRGEVALHIHGKWIRNVSFFYNTNDAERAGFTIAVALSLTTESFEQRETIVRVGDVCNKFYIVNRGLVASLGRIMAQGKFFGDDIILNFARRFYNVVAITMVDCSTLHKVDLERILAEGDFPVTRKRIRQAAVKLALWREIIALARMKKANDKVLEDAGMQDIEDVQELVHEADGGMVPREEDLSETVIRRHKNRRMPEGYLGPLPEHSAGSLALSPGTRGSGLVAGLGSAKHGEGKEEAAAGAFATTHVALGSHSALEHTMVEAAATRSMKPPVRRRRHSTTGTRIIGRDLDIDTDTTAASAIATMNKDQQLAARYTRPSGAYSSPKALKPDEFFSPLAAQGYVSPFSAEGTARRKADLAAAEALVAGTPGKSALVAAVAAEAGGSPTVTLTMEQLQAVVSEAVRKEVSALRKDISRRFDGLDKRSRVGMSSRNLLDYPAYATNPGR